MLMIMLHVIHYMKFYYYKNELRLYKGFTTVLLV